MPPPILQLISSAGYYGAERVLVELALHLRDSGWDSRVGVFRHSPDPIPLADEARRQGLTVVEFPCHGQLDRALPRAIGNYATREQLGLIHSHGYKSDIYLGLAPLPTTTRRVATCHNWLSGGLKLKIYQWLDIRALRRFDHVIAVSEPVLQVARAGGVRPDRSRIIENGLNSPVVRSAAVTQIRADFTAAPDDFLVIQIGRLSPEKGNDLLLRAFATATNVAPTDVGPTQVAPTHVGPIRTARLIFAGDGPERASLEQLAATLGLTQLAGGKPRVIFTGYRTDVPALLTAADLFVISSHYEGLPTVLLEAMAAARPIIASRVGMIPTVLENGAAGGLIPPGDLAALTHALRSVLQNPAAMEPMTRRARQRYEDHFSREAMGAKYESVYRSVLQA